jgi:hypothetical protein
MTADYDATSTWLDWIQNGGEYNQTQEKDALCALPDGWKTAPIGGEQTGSMKEEEIYLHNLDQTIQLLKISHTTFIGPASPFDEEYGGVLQSGIDNVLATIGYRLFVKEMRMPSFVHFDDSFKATVTFANGGIAPMYYNWQTVFYLIDENGIIQLTRKVNIDLRKVLPGEYSKVSLFVPTKQLENGKYTVAIAILDPITGKPAVKFAMDNIRPDLIQVLGTIEINHFYD